MYRFLFIILTTIIVFSEATAAKLEVTIENITNNEGSIRFALFSQDIADRFPSDDPKMSTPMLNHLGEKINGVVVPAKEGAISFTVFVPEGIYAAAAFHDQNGDEELNYFFIIPVEPYGFSNNVRGMFGPASFNDAKFSIPKNGTSLIFDIL